MNAPERLANAALGVLDTLSICYAPLIDKKRKAIGTRLTMLASNPNDRPPIGRVLEALIRSGPNRTLRCWCPARCDF